MVKTVVLQKISLCSTQFHFSIPSPISISARVMQMSSQRINGMWSDFLQQITICIVPKHEFYFGNVIKVAEQICINQLKNQGFEKKNNVISCHRCWFKFCLASSDVYWSDHLCQSFNCDRICHLFSHLIRDKFLQIHID